MKIILFSLYFLISACLLNAQIVINEVMYAHTTTTEKEWFEIYNKDTSSINLSGLAWKDATSTIHTVVAVANNIYINPQQYAIVCQDSVALKLYHPGISGKIFQTSWSALNDTGDDIILIKNGGQRYDSLHYLPSWGGSTDGYSLERINPNGSTNNQSNWGTSTDAMKSTPNRQNSITPKLYDLQLKSFLISPSFPKAGDSLNFSFNIFNKGLNSANNFILNIYRDQNLDSIPQTGEIIYSKNFNTNIINPNDSLIFRYVIQNIDSGFKQYIGKIIYSQDNDTLNNVLVNSINVGSITASTGLIINEIMYAPQSPEPEWIELYNNSNLPVDIKNWKISDSSAQTNPVTITSSTRLINSKDYLVIAKSNSILLVHSRIDTSKIIYLSSLPTFNNDGDAVIIFNNVNARIDQVFYKPGWGGSSKNSLERISPDRLSNDSTNWATSLDCEYSSPTRQNSIINFTAYLKNDLVINEIMYDPLTGNSEWLELYNPTFKYLNLIGWKINISSNIFNLFDTCNIIIKPNEYIVFAADTTIYKRFPDLKRVDSSRRIIFNKSLSLNNEGALIRIIDAVNNVIDSVNYNPKWHNNNIPDTKGYSLEKINPLLGSNDRSNWCSCTSPNGGTPGSKNSIYTQNQITSSNLSVSPNPFSPDGDGFEDFTIIKYKIISKIAQLRVKVFDVKGRLVRTLLNNQISGSEGQIIFDGKNDSGEKLRIGIYILFLEAIDDRGGTVEQVKTTVVVAAKL